MEHNDFEHCRGRNSWYLVVINRLKECTIRVAPEYHHYVFHLDKDEAKLCEMMELEEVELLENYVFSRHGRVRHVRGGWKENQWTRYHLYLIAEDVHSKNLCRTTNHKAFHKQE